MNAMLDPRIVAASVSRLRFRETTTRDGGVAPMTPASHGGRVKPTIWASRKHAYEAAIVRADAWVGNAPDRQFRTRVTAAAISLPQRLLSPDLRP
jgi:hypothetical protein